MPTVDQLILELANDAKPVKRLPPRQVRFAVWFIVSALYVGVGVGLLGLRPDLHDRLQELSYLGQLGLAGAAAFSSAWSALALSVPGAEHRIRTRLIPVSILAAWTSWMLYRMVSFVADPRIWIAVIREYSFEQIGIGLLLASLPGILLFLMIRRAAPLRPGWAGGLALITAGALSTLGGLLTCDNPCPIHAVVLYIAPMLALGAVGLGAGWLWLRRFR